jgi:DNA-binding NarL/FixJ family response regulator
VLRLLAQFGAEAGGSAEAVGARLLITNARGAEARATDADGAKALSTKAGRSGALATLGRAEAVGERSDAATRALDPIAPVESLTERELEVLHLIALGSTNREIAQQLFVATGTVKAHTSSIYRKLDAGNRTEAVARARLLGILP